MKKILLFLSAVLVFSQMQAQNAWRPKADFGGTALAQATGFSIGSKGYIGTGYDGSYKKDFWEYDPATNAWTQKADFYGTARNGATGFSIGSKGYIGTGNGASSFTNDFWEYNPAINQWRQIADFPGTGRQLATGFSIGSKGYLGTGISSGSINKRDFWEYDPATNQWTQKADFGGTARYLATGFSIGSKGYIGTGISSGSLKRDFWDYDPATDQWTQKADFGGAARFLATGFSIGSKGYIGTGDDFRSYKNDFWNYDPATDAWTQKADFGGTARRRAIGFSIGSKGYIGMGEGADGSNKKDFWEYDPAPATLLSASYFCADYPVTVRFSTDGTYNTGNTFTAQLSDASGSFASPAVIIGSINSTTSGSIDAVIPGSTPAGTAYRIRVVSSDPVFTGPDNGTDLTVTAPHTYYVDADHDGFGSTTTAMLCSPTAPDGYATNNTDCAPTDGTKWRSETLYIDRDNDGYDDGTESVCYGATIPAGYNATTLGSDCAPIDATKHASYLFYVDLDADGYGAGDQVSVCAVDQNTPPEGYSTNNTDCNDARLLYADSDGDGFGAGTPVACGVANNTDCNDASLLYADSDGDGFGAGAPVACGVANNTDCNDGNKDINPTTVWYLDADNDGYYTGSGITQCASPGSGYRSTGLTSGGDCDDSRLLYADSDGDGFGAGAPVACGVANNTDCNDSNTDINPTTVWYLDADNDGYYTGSGIIQCVSPGQGYRRTGLTSGGDCDDANLLYADSDGDGFGAGTPVACGVANNTDCNDASLLYADSDGDGFGAGAPVACGVANNTDCNDGNKVINPTTVWYLDADNDGYYTGSGITQCASPGSGYRSTVLTSGGDCDDSRLLYADSDGDGFGAGAPVACGVANNTDCNDALGTVHPGAVEICANGIDDNCNGQIDENCGSVPRISINDVTVYESEGVAVLTISLDRVSTSAISVKYATQNGTAIGSGKGVKTFDFTSASSSVTIPAGTKTAQIRITITKDNITEAAENFRVNLSLDTKNVKKATITKSSGTVTINDGIKPALTSTQSRRIVQPAEDAAQSLALDVSAYPNPSTSSFTVKVSSNNKKDVISMTVIDMNGRVIEKRNNLTTGKTLQIGSKYRPGLYFVEMLQGKARTQVKLLKAVY